MHLHTICAALQSFRNAFYVVRIAGQNGIDDKNAVNRKHSSTQQQQQQQTLEKNAFMAKAKLYRYTAV